MPTRIDFGFIDLPSNFGYYYGYHPMKVSIRRHMESTTSVEAETSFRGALTADLLAGKYSPGAWLKQADLEETYGANRFEVRIALAELNVRGLLEHMPNRGYRVCNHTHENYEHLSEVRILLEVAASRLVVQRATEQQIDEFERLVNLFEEEAAESGSRDRMRELNYHLHNQLYSMAGNPLLASQINDLRQRGTPGRTGLWDAVKSVKASIADHFEMLDMLKRRDAEGLAAVVYRHLNRWRKYSKPIAPSKVG